MPLDKSGSQASVGQNISQLQKEKYPHNQAIAIALSIQRRAQGHAAGGGIPWFARQEARDMERYGMVNGATPGRADARPTGVRGGAYVVPADIVSGIGQGNSINGAAKLSHMFNMNPKAGPSLPGLNKTAKMVRQKFAQGGEIPIQVSDGEFLIPPEKVAELGNGDINHGHDILDELVALKRKETIQHLASLPSPRDSKQQMEDGGEVDAPGGEEEFPQHLFSPVSEQEVDDALSRPKGAFDDLNMFMKARMPGPQDQSSASDARQAAAERMYNSVRRNRPGMFGYD